MLKIITDKHNWDQILTNIGTFDFYHTFDYHQLSKKTNEEPLLVVYENDDEIVAIPFFKRKIDGTSYFDFTSAYGYTGPVSKITETFDNSTFIKLLGDYLLESNIISVFLRMNPYIEFQNNILEGLGKIDTLGKLVNIDLKLNLAESRAAYRKDTKSRVNKARRECSIRLAESDEDINSFIDIYTETMQKLDANASYFFDSDYFFNFLNCDGFKTEILLAIHNETGEAIAGSMFVMTNNIIQYHLSGTRSEYMRVAPSRILLDEMRIKGTESGFEYFNLGGGYQSKEDALFSFKNSFSKDIKPYTAWKYITNSEVYNELSKGKEESSFFPLYRS